MSQRRRNEEIAAAVVSFTVMNEDTIYDEPTRVDAEQGAVILKGPGAVDIRMTPAAAEETSERLLEGAMKARGQQFFSSDGGS